MNQLTIVNHQKAAFEARFYTVEQLQAFHNKASLGFKFAVLASWFLSAFFIGQFMAGSEFEYMSEWRTMQFIYASMGIFLATALTFGEMLLFNSGRMREYWFLAAVLICFGVFAEGAATMQREQMSVKFKSEQSPVFKATLNAANQLAKAPALSPSQIRLANVQNQLENARRNNDAVQVANLQGRVSQLENQINMEMANTQHLLSTTLSKAKELEYDETNHQAIIRLMSELFGISHVISSSLLAFFLIITFKMCAHYLGTRKTQTERSIDIKTGRLAEVISASFEWTPLPAGQSVPLQSPENGQNRIAADVTRTHTDNTDKPIVRVTDNLEPTQSKMISLYEIAQQAKAGDLIACPLCELQFKKKTYNQCFCKSDCKDTFHNIVKPERLLPIRGVKTKQG